MVFVYAIETYPDEKNGNCVSYWVSIFPVSTKSTSFVCRGLNEVEIFNSKGKVKICKGQDCIDQMLNHIIKKRKNYPNIIRKESNC